MEGKDALCCIGSEGQEERETAVVFYRDGDKIGSGR